MLFNLAFKHPSLSPGKKNHPWQLKKTKLGGFQSYFTEYDNQASLPQWLLPT